MSGYVLLILLPHAITLGVFFWLFKSRRLNGTGKMINGIVALLWVAFIFQAAPWGLTNYYLRFLYPIVLVILFVVLGRSKTQTQKSDVLYRFRLNRYIRLVVISGLAVLNFLVLLSSYYPKEEAIELQIPFRSGAYYVMQGGNSPITNYFHRSHKSQQYALDIAQLNRWGFRAKGIHPKNLEKYMIYGDTVISPMDGRVVTAQDGLPDLVPPKTDKENSLGNHIRIQQGDKLVLLGHFIPGSLMVNEGDDVKAGQPLALVGNSGNSIEPHLHIQVVKMDLTENRPTWEPVPFRMNGQFYHLNDRINAENHSSK